MKTKLMFGLGLAASPRSPSAMTMWSSRGDYKVLAANLSDKDGGAIIAQLSQMNVPTGTPTAARPSWYPVSKVHDAAP